MVNIVLAFHVAGPASSATSSKPYLFRLPDGVSVKKGEYLFLSKNKLLRAACDSADLDEAGYRLVCSVEGIKDVITSIKGRCVQVPFDTGNLLDVALEAAQNVATDAKGAAHNVSRL